MERKHLKRQSTLTEKIIYPKLIQKYQYFERFIQRYFIVASSGISGDATGNGGGMTGTSSGYAIKRSFTLKPTTTKPGVCASNPCVHGQCQPFPSMNTYVCKCIHGASGRNCEKEIDMCSMNPCVSGTCSGHGLNFTCTCNKGYTGKLCDKEINICKLFNPCAFGTCSGLGAQYTCTCDQGWTGKLCDSKVLSVNGGWTSWTTWNTCTLTCGTGTSSRTRSCTKPVPQNKGAQCSGPAIDTKQCNSNNCPGTMTGGTSGVCVDKLTNCQSYTKAVCSNQDYAQWVQDNCCAFCNGGTGGVMTEGTMTGGACQDAIPNCKDYTAAVCTDSSYTGWVTKNCPRFCNRCGSACSDAIANCESYDLSICTSADYKQWASQNCAATCNLCSSMSGIGTMTGTGGIMTGTGDITSGSSSGCVYISHLYRQGESWKDGCKFNCQCVDGSTGKYQCSQLCVQWQLPSQCHMSPPAQGKCCQTPSCPAGFNIQYPQGYTEQ